MNRIVLITGASRGLGASMAKLFLENGDYVFINYHKSIKEAQKIASKYEKAILLPGDVSNESEIKSMFKKVKEQFGRLDILINNAGIAIDTIFEEKNKENFIKTLDINLIGPFLMCKYARSIMNEGCIINISSTNAIDTYYPYSLDYDASKAGLISLTNNLALVYGPKVRVNAIAPGWINTDMNKNLDSEYIKEECEHIILNRFAEPEEIAKVALFLASPDASYINSTVIRVDGGKKS